MLLFWRNCLYKRHTVIDCPLQLNKKTKLWQCPDCGWVYKPRRPTFLCRKPPRRNCPAKRTPEQIAEQEKQQKQKAVQQIGVGTELKKLLANFHISSKGGCGCDQRAALMNVEGPDWCEQNINMIVGWMKKEASKRKLRFIFNKNAAKVLVKLAIRNTRKKLKILEQQN